MVNGLQLTLTQRHLKRIYRGKLTAGFLAGLLTGCLACSYSQTRSSTPAVKTKRVSRATLQRAQSNALLVWEAQDGNFERVFSSIMKGADVNVRFHTRLGPGLSDEFFGQGQACGTATLLIYSVAHRQRRLVDELLRRHASVDARGDIALEIAPRDYDAEYVESFANITALHVAAIVGDPSLISKLIHSKAQIETPDPNGDTALAMAVAYHHPEALSELIKAGANINVTNNKKATPLIIAAQSRNLAAIKQLLLRGAKTSPRDATGRTALSFAAQYADLPIAHELVKAGSDVNLEDNEGYTVLRRSAETGDKKLYASLKAAGAKGEFRVEDLHGVIK